MIGEYYDRVYQKKVGYSSNLTEYAIDKGIKDFEKYLSQTPTRQDIVKDGQLLQVSIQNSHQSREGERYEKNILAPLNYKLKVGDLFQWKDETWIILTKELLAVPTHFKGKIRLCNRALKWCQAGQIKKTPAYIVSSGSASLDSSTRSGFVLETGSTVLLATIPSNEINNAIKRYDRFIIKQQAWKVAGVDSVTVDNLLFIRLEEDQINLAVDDLENEIADRYSKEEQYHEIDDSIYLIEGPDSLVWNQTAEYKGLKDEEIPVTHYSFSTEQEELITILQSEDNPNVINVKANTGAVEGVAVLQWHVEGLEAPIVRNIKIVSLWGE